jgi:hypothetical protein
VRVIAAIQSRAKRSRVELTNCSRRITKNHVKVSFANVLKNTAAGFPSSFSIRTDEKVLQQKHDQKKVGVNNSPIGNINRIIEDTNNQLNALNAIRALVNKDFDQKNSIVVKLLNNIDELKNFIQKLNDDATDTLNKKLSDSIPQQLVIHTKKIEQWLNTGSGIGAKSVSVKFNMNTTLNNLAYVAAITAKGVKSGGIELDYYIYITYIPGKKSYALYIGVFNEPVPISALHEYNYGKHFVTNQEAIDVLKVEFGLDTSNKLKPANPRINERRQVEKKSKWTPSNVTIESVKVARENKKAVLKIVFGGDVDATKSASETIFLRLKEWRARIKQNNNADYGLTMQTLPSKRKTLEVHYTFVKKNALTLQQSFITELFVRLGQKTDRDKFVKAFKAFS